MRWTRTQAQLVKTKINIELYLLLEISSWTDIFRHDMLFFNEAFRLGTGFVIGLVVDGSGASATPVTLDLVKTTLASDYYEAQ